MVPIRYSRRAPAAGRILLGAVAVLLAVVSLAPAAMQAAAPEAPPAPAAPAAPAAQPAVEQISEHWFVIELAGARAGWARDTVTADAERYTSSSEASFRISRGPISLEISMSAEFVETRDGRPLTLRFKQDMSQQVVDTEWTFEEDGVRSVTRQGGREIVKKLPVPEGEWLTPRGVHRYLVERMQANAEEIVFRTLDGENELVPTRYVHRRIGEEVFDWEGREVPVIVYESTNSVMPGMVGTTRISSDGFVVHESVMLGGIGEMVTRLATRDDALAGQDLPGPELFVKMFVQATPIPAPRNAERSRMTLRVGAGAMPALPSTGAQRVEPGDDDASARLVVDIRDNLPATDAERDDAAYLAPSPMVDTDDPMVKKLAERACRGAGDDALARADALRAFVARYISAKDLDTAFATASETARLRTGDCSEHGVLLCAMLRAAGIPARVATGLIYVEEIMGAEHAFGWHMWTQALIDGRWVDLDATLEGRYDALHVLTATSSLAQGGGAADLATVIQLLGNLEIEIDEVEYAADTEGRDGDQ